MSTPENAKREQDDWMARADTTDEIHKLRIPSSSSHASSDSEASPFAGEPALNQMPLPASNTVNNPQLPQARPPLAGNPGSAGHPEICRKPCMFAAKGNCESGMNCSFCHMDHRSQNLDKRHREQLRKMREEYRVTLFSEVFEERAIATGYITEVAEVVEILNEWKASFPKPQSNPPRRECFFGKLHPECLCQFL